MSNPYPPDIIDRLAFETIAHPSESLSDQAKLRMVLISIPDEVLRAIHELHQAQFAEVKYWSPLQRIPDSNAVLSMYTRTPKHRSI